jgi:hypothetical protein
MKHAFSPSFAFQTSSSICPRLAINQELPVWISGLAG